MNISDVEVEYWNYIRKQRSRPRRPAMFPNSNLRHPSCRSANGSALCRYRRCWSSAIWPSLALNDSTINTSIWIVSLNSLSIYKYHILLNFAPKFKKLHTNCKDLPKNYYDKINPSHCFFDLFGIAILWYLEMSLKAHTLDWLEN